MLLTDYEVSTFDCYGTLIDWETGVYDALQGLIRKGGVKLTQNAVLATFSGHETALESEALRMPTAIYTK